MSYVERVPWSSPMRSGYMALTLACLAGTVAAVASVPARDRLVAALVSVPGVAVVAGVGHLFRELTIELDDEELWVGFSPVRRRVPLREIARCEPISYRWLDWGGWGIRWRPGRTLYNVPGDQGQAVQLTLTNGKHLLFSSRESRAWCERLRVQYPAIETA